MKLTKTQLKQIIKEELQIIEAAVGFSAAQRKAHPGIGTPEFQGSSLSPEEQEAVGQEMDTGIRREYAQDVVSHVREKIVSQPAQAMAGMSIGEFLRLAANIADEEDMSLGGEA